MPPPRPPLSRQPPAERLNGPSTPPVPPRYAVKTKADPRRSPSEVRCDAVFRVLREPTRRCGQRARRGVAQHYHRLARGSASRNRHALRVRVITRHARQRSGLAFEVAQRPGLPSPFGRDSVSRRSGLSRASKTDGPPEPVCQACPSIAGGDRLIQPARRRFVRKRAYWCHPPRAPAMRYVSTSPMSTTRLCHTRTAAIDRQLAP